MRSASRSCPRPCRRSLRVVRHRVRPTLRGRVDQTQPVRQLRRQDERGTWWPLHGNQYPLRTLIRNAYRVQYTRCAAARGGGALGMAGATMRDVAFSLSRIARSASRGPDSIDGGYAAVDWPRIDAVITWRRVRRAARLRSPRRQSFSSSSSNRTPASLPRHQPPGHQSARAV